MAADLELRGRRLFSVSVLLLAALLFRLGAAHGKGREPVFCGLAQPRHGRVHAAWRLADGSPGAAAWRSFWQKSGPEVRDDPKRAAPPGRHLRDQSNLDCRLLHRLTWRAWALR